MQRLLLAALIIIYTAALFGQSAKLKGRVLDSSAQLCPPFTSRYSRKKKSSAKR